MAAILRRSKLRGNLLFLWAHDKKVAYQALGARLPPKAIPKLRLRLPPSSVGQNRHNSDGHPFMFALPLDTLGPYNEGGVAVPEGAAPA